MSPTPVVATVGPAGSTPKGGTINISNSGGGRCRTHRQHPQAARHRRRQLRWWRVAKLGTYHQNFSGDTYQGGHRGKQYRYEQGEMEARNTITEKSKSTDSVTIVSIIRITKRERKATVGRKVYTSLGSRLNRSATTRAASSTPSLTTSVDPLTGPCTTGSREMLGSWLRKHISTWSATACARVWPSSSKRLPTASSSWDIFLPAESRRRSTTPASGAAFPPQIGLKPKDARAVSD
jgi:hypothetical protein